MSDRAFLESWSVRVSDFNFVAGYHQSSQLWISLQLTYFLEHGYFPQHASDIPSKAVAYVSEQLTLPTDTNYDLSSKTARRHRFEIVAYNGKC